MNSMRLCAVWGFSVFAVACQETKDARKELDGAPVEQESMGLWLADSSCAVTSPVGPRGTVQACLRDSGEAFFDGRSLRQVVADYVCAPRSRRSAIAFRVQAPPLADSLFSIASRRLRTSKINVADRKYVQSAVDSYSALVKRSELSFQTLLPALVESLESDSAFSRSLEQGSGASGLAELALNGCESTLPLNAVTTVSGIVSEGLQRLAYMFYPFATDQIARANLSVEIDAAGLSIPPSLFTTNSADRLSSIYGEVAPGNGSLGEEFADIELVGPNGLYTRFAVPVRLLPLPAARFLGMQKRSIAAQIPRIVRSLRDAKKGEVIEVYVPEPSSAKVFPPRMWAEHILWQVAFRNAIAMDTLPLVPSWYEKYGLR